MNLLRARLTYANVTSTLCLFLLLGGGAYAASQLPANSVGTKQLKNGAVTKAKIAASARKALRGHEGPQGPKGAQGAKGSKGAQGPKGATGSKGDPGAPGTGPIFETDWNGSVDEIEVTASPTPVISENLPAGAYGLSGNIVFSNHTDTNPAVVECTLSAGGESASAGIYISGTAAAMQMTLPLQLSHTFASAGSASLSCEKAFESGSAWVSYASLIATQAKSQTRTQIHG